MCSGIRSKSRVSLLQRIDGKGSGAVAVVCPRQGISGPGYCGDAIFCRIVVDGMQVQSTATSCSGRAASRSVLRVSSDVQRVRNVRPAILPATAEPAVGGCIANAGPLNSTRRTLRSSRAARIVASASSDVYDAVVVGAGVSGLVTALSLHTTHSDKVGSFLVTEARERVGGNITSMANDQGYVWEEGPNSFQPNDFMLRAAVRAAPFMWP